MNYFRQNIFLNKSIFKRFISNTNFGILFDIDGVLIQGHQGIDGAKKMFKIIIDKFQSKIPVVFLTNSSDAPENKAATLNSIFDINISSSHIIHAPAPLKLFHNIHNKRIVFVGQGNMKQIAEDLHFTNVVDLHDIQRAFPTLDVMDKSKRQALKNGYVERGMDPIEGIVLLGEPTDWQSYLQILSDLLVTHGDLTAPVDTSSQKLPIYLTNLDFLYKGESRMLRYGNGAFIHCLEMLYKKFTGLDLKYSAVIGKPGEISFRYAEHILNSINRQINGNVDLLRMYMVGDNPVSDILGANLYQHFIDQPNNLPSYRSFPSSIDVQPRTVKSIKSFLVKTGVYDETNDICDQHQHWTFTDINSSYLNPTMIVDDCLEAFYRILELEQIEAIRM